MKKISIIVIMSFFVVMLAGSSVFAGSSLSYRRARAPRILRCTGAETVRTQYILDTLCNVLDSNNLSHELCGSNTQDPPVVDPPVEPPVTVDSDVVISEVYYDVADDKGELDDEWVELYNAGNSDVDISLWKIGDNDGSLDEIPEGTTLPAGAYALISRSATTFTTYWPDAVPTSTLTIALDGKIGSNGLASTGDTVILQDADESLVDMMSYGSEPEGAERAFDPGADDVVKGHSLSRDSNGTDTDTAADWIDLELPTPGM